MITQSVNMKQYRSAHDRFLKPVIVNFLVHELRYLGPVTAAIIAIETNHSQRAVDHYIRDYNRVKILLDDN